MLAVIVGRDNFDGLRCFVRYSGTAREKMLNGEATSSRVEAEEKTVLHYLNLSSRHQIIFTKLKTEPTTYHLVIREHAGEEK